MANIPLNIIKQNYLLNQNFEKDILCLVRIRICQQQNIKEHLYKRVMGWCFFFLKTIQRCLYVSVLRFCSTCKLMYYGSKDAGRRHETPESKTKVLSTTHEEAHPSCQCCFPYLLGSVQETRAHCPSDTQLKNLLLRFLILFLKVLPFHA